jgi:hypothetical protein
MITGLFGLFVFCADVWAIASILKSKVPGGTKVLWCLLVLLLPLLGLIIWYVAGPKS